MGNAMEIITRKECNVYDNEKVFVGDLVEFETSDLVANGVVVRFESAGRTLTVESTNAENGKVYKTILNPDFDELKVIAKNKYELK